MSPSPSNTFLIIVSEVLIAQDIEMTIRRLWPDAVVLFKNNIKDAEIWLESTENLLYAFISASPETHETESVFTKVAALGGKFVMLGYDETAKVAFDAFAHASAMLFLPFPFTEEHLIKVLKK